MRSLATTIWLMETMSIRGTFTRASISSARGDSGKWIQSLTPCQTARMEPVRVRARKSITFIDPHGTQQRGLTECPGQQGVVCGATDSVTVKGGGGSGGSTINLPPRTETVVIGDP
jgi:hypothetical protein